MPENSDQKEEEKEPQKFFEDPGPFVQYDKDINRKPWDTSHDANGTSTNKGVQRNPFTDQSFFADPSQAHLAQGDFQNAKFSHILD